MVERNFTIHEVTDAIKEGRMIEAFGAGTAAVVSPVQLIHFAGTDYKVRLPLFTAFLLSRFCACAFFCDLSGISGRAIVFDFDDFSLNPSVSSHRCR